MSADPRILYWTRSESAQNFGDYLSSYIARRALLAPIYEAAAYRLIGSVIETHVIRADFGLFADPGATIAYWGCGMRGPEPIAAELVGRCRFFGVRGPHTRAALGLDDDTPLGDPGLLMPLLYAARRRTSPLAGRVLCMPHFSQRLHPFDLAAIGAQAMLSPAIGDDEELERLIDAIAQADFLLTGSLHGAILAAAYGTPFAFWDSGFVDIPFKWADFAASIGIEPQFVTSVEEGRADYERIRDALQPPKLSSILGCCPLAVRPSVLLAALAFDAGLGDAPTRALQAIAGGLWIERPENAELLRTHAAETAARRNVSAAAARRSLALDEMARMGAQISALAEDCAWRREALGLALSPARPVVRFGAGEPGAGLLESGWTRPNAVAPWSLAPRGVLRFPAGLGWEAARRVTFRGYVFAPVDRKAIVYAGDARVAIPEFRQGAPHTYMTEIAFDLPEPVKAAGLDLVLRFEMEAVGSLARLGLGDDDREIGFAPVEAAFQF